MNPIKKLSTAVYTPDSVLRKPGKMIGDMFKDIAKSRELAWRLFVRNISAMYRQTMLGYFWAFLPPVATTLTFVFLNKQNILSVGETDIPYPVYVMVGTLLWQVFVDAMNSPLKLVASSKAMLAKIKFPRESLIMAGVYEVLFNFVIRLILLAGVMVWFRIELPLTAIYAPFGIIALIMLGLMFGILLTPLGVLYQDIEKGLLMIISVWFFLTPVVYPSPTSFPANLISTINPVSPLLITTRELITTGNISDVFSFLVVAGITLILIFLGWIIYRVAMPHLIVRMGA